MANESKAWIGFAQGAYINTAMEPGPLRQLTPLAVSALAHEETYDAAVELFTDVLATFSAFFTAKDFEAFSVLLTSSQTQEVVSRLKAGDFEDEKLQFAGFLTAYGDVTVQDLARYVLSRAIFPRLGRFRGPWLKYKAKDMSPSPEDVLKE